MIRPQSPVSSVCFDISGEGNISTCTHTDTETNIGRKLRTPHQFSTLGESSENHLNDSMTIEAHNYTIIKIGTIGPTVY